MKKICIMLMLIFVCSVGAVSAEQIYYEDFESRSIWREIATTTYTRHNIIDIGYDSETQNHYGYTQLDMDRAWTGPFTEIAPQMYESDILTFEASVMISNDNGKSDSYIFLYDEQNKYTAPIKINNGVLYTNAYGTGSTIELLKMEEGKFYHVGVVINFKTHTYDLYVDDKLMASNVGMGNFKGSSIMLMRMQIQGIQSGCSDVRFGYDNFVIHTDSVPIPKEEWTSKTMYDTSPKSLRERVKNLQFFYKNAPRAYMSGELVELPEACYYEAEELYIPLRFVVERLGGEVLYDNQTGEITAKMGDTVVSSSDKSIVNKDGLAFVSSAALSRLLGLPCQLDRVGFAAIGNEEYFYDWTSEIKVIFKTISQLTLDIPDGVEIAADATKNIPSEKHPRIFATEEQFDIIRREVESGEEPFASWWKYVKDIADKELSEPCLNFQMTDEDHASANIQGVQYRLARWGLMYWVTGDMKYAERGKAEIVNMCNPETWPDWNFYNALDVGEASYAAAIGYDMFYDVMNESERASVREAIKNNAFKPYLEDIYDISYSKGLGKRTDDVLDRGYDWVRNLTTRHNWTAIVDGGIIMSALAICDDEDSKQIAREVLGASVNDIKEWFEGFLPDGAWHEGPTYWTYMMNYFTGSAIALDNTCGTDYGLTNLPALDLTGEYLYSLHGPGGVFNFSDAAPANMSGSKTIFWYAKRYNNKGLFDTAVRFINNKGNVHTPEQLRDYALAKHHFETSNGKSNDLPKDNYFRKIETALLRDSWDDTSANFIAIHGGRNDDPHAQMDSGTIILDALGKRFILDLGRDNYNIAGGTDKYHNNTMGHNLICFNPTANVERGGQTYKAGANVTRFDSNKVDSFTVMDLTDVWSGYVSEYQRGIRLTDEKNVFILQDEYEIRDNVNDMWWFAHFNTTDVVLSEDKRSATVTIGNVKLDVHILTDQEGEFEIMDPVGLPGSRTAALKNQTVIRDVKRLSFHFKNAESGTFAVAFVPYRMGFANDRELPEVTPIDEWTLVDDSYYSEGDIATVEQIYIDGEPIGNFMPDSNTYSVELPFGTREVPQITVKEENAKVIKSVDSDDVYYVVAGEGSTENIYTVNFTRKVVFEPVAGMKELPFAEITVTNEPQPENNRNNMTDNDFSTRWSSRGPCAATIDLGEIKDIDVIGLSWYLGKTRRSEIEIHISEDGENWERVFVGESTGESEEFEYYDVGESKARYVRVTGYRTTESDWISITEFKVFAIEE